MLSKKKKKIVNELIKNKVETRPLVAGSIGNQPFYIKDYGPKKLINADLVDKYGLYVPNHPGLTEKDIIFITNIINKMEEE